MERKYHTFLIKDIHLFKQKLLQWAAKYKIACFLDNHQYDSHYSAYECLAAAGCIKRFDLKEDLFSSLSSFVNNTNDWIFGHLNYDIKNHIENLYSNNIDNINFPDVFLFVPEIVLIIKQSTLTIGLMASNADVIFNEINQQQIREEHLQPVNVAPRISKEEYIQNIQHLKHPILRGECYEINYAQEFYAENAHISPVVLYRLLTRVSPNPFCSFYRLNNKYLLCASPERYIKKEGENILSQPIKGTAKRGVNDEEDRQIKQALLNSKKDRKENIIVVDLVRNDLSRICEKGSVHVEELCAVYTFPGVHQLISTVKGKLRADAGFGDIIKSTFPMGSMTGAPKKRVMQLIEEYEQTKRGIYSGTVGYITPAKDFDFNVVIRSIMYNDEKKYVSYQVGGAITFESDPESEYEECIVKAAAITQILSGKLEKNT
ncbi:anthranilate synthase component I family protein [Segetibacter koreensis]|uniref:anthranilate synthase component I family protein n=1 Tax=Segetibacter koreensis TaxID=398037 RepID=UPI0003703032|nr:anthranilate synthase component I family protein [Segetibacter koreensis]